MPDSPFLGEIQQSAISFFPRATLECNGALLPIAQFDTLHLLLGEKFGGDGELTFALPDLRGRVPIGMGQGPNLSDYPLGKSGGSETASLDASNLPPHTHSATFVCQAGEGNVVYPLNNAPAADGGGVSQKYAAAANDTMGAQQTGNAGSGYPAPIIQPFSAIRYFMFVEGVYPAPPN